MVRPTMMNTIMVVSQVSFQLGQVTFFISRRTCWKNSTGPTRRAGGGASASPAPPAFFVNSAIKSLLLCPTATLLEGGFLNWQEWRDSNPRPSVLETDALPTELHSLMQGSGHPLARPSPCYFNSILRR